MTDSPYFFDHGGPAFPHGNPDKPDGMKLRDYFAAKALPGVLYMVAHGVHSLAGSADGCAAEAYILADAMLKARKP